MVSDLRSCRSPGRLDPIPDQPLSAEWGETRVVLHEGEGGIIVERVGTEVRRPTYPAAPAVMAVLRHLERVEFAAVPRWIGVADGELRLTYIEGEAGGIGWNGVLTDDGLAAAARLIRRYHDAIAGLTAVDLPWSSGHRGGPRPGEVVLHGDPGPWNMVWSDGQPVALIDFEHVTPGHPLDDIAYFAAYTAPMCDDHEATTWMRHPRPPDRSHRLAIIAEAYGTTTDELIERAAPVIAKTNRTVERLASLGVEPQATWCKPGGRIDAFWSRHRWIVDTASTIVRKS